MTAKPIPLATQLADLRAAAEAHTGRCWLTRALEAMIMAALARIFGRLEELVRLWQAGLLPALSSPTMQSPALANPAMPRQRPHAQSRSAPGASLRAPSRAPTRPTSGNHTQFSVTGASIVRTPRARRVVRRAVPAMHPAGIAPRGATGPTTSPHAARAPPPADPPKGPMPGAHNRAYIVTLSK